MLCCLNITGAYSPAETDANGINHFQVGYFCLFSFPACQILPVCQCPLCLIQMHKVLFWHQAETHKGLMYLQCKAILLRSVTQCMKLKSTILGFWYLWFVPFTESSCCSLLCALIFSLLFGLAICYHSKQSAISVDAYIISLVLSHYYIIHHSLQQ